MRVNRQLISLKAPYSSGTRRPFLVVAVSIVREDIRFRRSILRCSSRWTRLAT